MKVLLIILALVASALAAKDTWVILVAGSNTYSNYRHQADVLHAYHIMKDTFHVKDNHIVLMMYDDIANNARNPIKGNVINKPNGTNVYIGVKADFIGNQVTAANFLSVLSGSGHVDFNPQDGDNIFIFYSDHGSPGLVAMPVGSPLYATQLLDMISKLYSNKRFGKMVVFIEACESGSMLEKLPASEMTWGTTASNPSESSYAFYYDSVRQAYLGDEYSIHWMETVDESPSSLTFDELFQTVKKETKGSHVMEYGDMNWVNENFAAFFTRTFASRGNKHHGPHRPAPAASDRIAQWDVAVDLAKRQYAKTGAAEDFAALQTEIANRAKIEAVSSSVLAKAAVSRKPSANEDADCGMILSEELRVRCDGANNEYWMRGAGKFMLACRAGQVDVEVARKAIIEACA